MLTKIGTGMLVLEIECLINTETKYPLPYRLTLNLDEINNIHGLSVHVRELIRVFKNSHFLIYFET